MAEERNQVVPPVRSPLAPDLPAPTPLTASELDDVDVPRSVSVAGVGPGGAADRLDVGVPPRTTAAASTGAALESDDPDVIREQIERTREDMSQTINELQDRLSPQHLAQQARDSVREATVGRVQQMVGSAGEKASEVARRAQDAAAPVMEQVGERPVPIALAGVGAGLALWLMRRASSRQNWSRNAMDNWNQDTTGTRGYAATGSRDYPPYGRDDYRPRERWQGDSGWLSALRDNPVPASIAAASIGYMLWSRRSSTTSGDAVDLRSTYDADYDSRYGASTTERVGTAARQAREKASELGNMASETASELGHQLTGTVRSARTRAGQMSRDTSTEFDRWMQENPLAVGVAAMAVGAAVGLVVPVTRVENRAMGASRDALMERASDSAQQLKDQVRDKVQEVAGDLTNGSSTTTGFTSAAPDTTPL